MRYICQMNKDRFYHFIDTCKTSSDAALHQDQRRKPNAWCMKEKKIQKLQRMTITELKLWA